VAEEIVGQEMTEHPAPVVELAVEAGTARLTVRGELAEAARRPVVRALTDLMLAHEPLRRVELLVDGVSFMNSAGMAVLVQVQRMAAPRGIEVVLVAPPAAVVRPLQLSGLWHRFPMVDVPEHLQADDGGS
jgi:stage II sporulation protein AA (anti-sigma F factor antagonist)